MSDGVSALLTLQAADLRVATVAFRLASAGVAVCPIVAGLTGITLHDASQYPASTREAARLAFGLGDHVAVAAVAPGSPAGRAGIVAGDGIVAIGDRPLAPAVLAQRASYDAVAAAYAALEAAAAKGTVPLRIERGDRRLAIDLVPAAGCASRVQLRSDRTIYAGASGSVLTVTTGLLAYVANDDELALAMAHEMAHNVLGHRASLAARDGSGDRSRAGEAAVRATEAAADRLAYVLMARAGYDVGVAEGFWRRLYAGPARGRANAATHRDLDSRIADARAALRDRQPIE